MSVPCPPKSPSAPESAIISSISPTISGRANPPTRYGLVLFPGFQALDVFGPLDALNTLNAGQSSVSLFIISETLSPVPTWSAGGSFHESVQPTHTLADPPPDLDVLMVPGGLMVEKGPIAQVYVDFVAMIYAKVRYLFTVCTGSAVAARAGVLKCKRATGNKASWPWVVTQGYGEVKWVEKARWVVDGNIWTSSGIAAGIDMAFAWIKYWYGEDMASEVADVIEYTRHEEGDDPFAEIWERRRCETAKGKEEGGRRRRIYAD